MERLKTVLVGCGGICNAWLKSDAVKTGVQIVAAVDLDAARARKVLDANALAGAEASNDLRAMLAKHRPQVVFDCTIPEAHHAVTLTALAAGCHVLGEKPMADTMEHAREMVAAAKQAGRLYAVIQNRRYLPGMVRLRDFLRSGVLGRIHTVHQDFLIAAHFGGFRATMDHVLLLDMAIHSFDQARFLTGTDPVAVQCLEWNPPGSNYRHGACAIADFRMSGDLILSYRGNWTATGIQTSWECQWKIAGDRGTVLWDGTDTGFKAERVKNPDEPSNEKGGPLIRTLEPVEVPALTGDVPYGRGHNGMIADFLDAVRTGRIPQTVCTDNIKSLAMVHAAIQAAAERREVPVAG